MSSTQLTAADALHLAFAPILTQCHWLRSGLISPLQLTQVYLDRIGQWDDRLGSYVAVMAEAAIAQATLKTDQLVAARREARLGGDRLQQLPLLHGIPIAIKDLNAVAQWPQSYGIAALREAGNLSLADDGVVQRLRQAGCIFLGKTTISQLASWPYSEPPGFAPSRNPWQLSHSSGGSSGGSAAAVAAGLASAALGSDGGGSIRTPAFCCGLVGLKPSRGRISYAPSGDALGGMAVNGPLGRRVADSALLLDAMAGPALGDWEGVAAAPVSAWSKLAAWQWPGGGGSRISAAGDEPVAALCPGDVADLADGGGCSGGRGGGDREGGREGGGLAASHCLCHSPRSVWPGDGCLCSCCAGGDPAPGPGGGGSGGNRVGSGGDDRAFC